MPDHSIIRLRKEIIINAPTKQVFAYLADFHHFQLFMPMIETIEVIDDIHSRWIIHAPLGYKVAFDSVITKFEPNSTLSWESRHRDAFARGELKLFEQGKYTRLELNFEYSLYREWMQKIARLVSRFGFPSLTFDHGLEHLKEKIESEIK